MKNTKNDFMKPVMVLMLICLVISTALAFTNEKTAPLIEQAEKAKAEAAQKEVLPEGDAFTRMELSGLPATVTEVYKADNGVGYIFMLTAKGYGGDMKLICGIGSDGKIVACSTLSHSETQGLGSKTAEAGFKDQFKGKDVSLGGVEAISGATISSKAYINAIKDAFAAYDIVKGAE